MIKRSISCFAVTLLCAIFAASAQATQKTPLPEGSIESALGAQGSIKNGVLSISIGRKDLGQVKGPRGVTFGSSFGIEGSAFFESIGKDRAILNGDFPLKEKEVNPFIRALLKNRLTVQAFHQHLPMLSPPVWFVHFRGVGKPIELAKELRAALKTTTTPFPQKEPASPATPLKVKKLEKILHGKATIHEGGIVTVWILRKKPVRLSGHEINPQLNVSSHVAFKPMKGGKVAALTDISMTARQVDPVLKLMAIQQGWLIGCLYNQETAERPQLFFSHLLKVGDPYQLALELRKALNLTDAK